MLTSLRFCSGSIASKDYVPALTHFVIEHGKVRGYNGVIALCSPIPFDISCRPKATTLIKAVGMCQETVQLSLTPAGRLSVKSGKFKAFIDCVQEITPHPLPEGQFIEFNGEELLKGIKAVAPFVGDDASRRWANGILVKDQSLFATNNVMLIQYWLGQGFPIDITIPQAAIKEMLRINEPPVYAQLADGNITFHYANERWLRTQLYDSNSWPEFGPILDKPSRQHPIEEELFQGLDVVKPFVDKQGSILFGDQLITTHTDDNEGASFEVPGLVSEGKYNIEMLMLLKGAAKSIDWSLYPNAALFSNDRLRGAIVGMRK